MDFLGRQLMICGEKFCVCSLIIFIIVFNSITSNRHEITCRVMHDDPELGLCAISKPRWRPQLLGSLKSNSVLQSEIKTLHRELTLDNDKKLVLMISFASDEMIWETMK